MTSETERSGDVRVTDANANIACASADCKNRATVHLEKGGVGSYYCRECSDRTLTATQQPPATIPNLDNCGTYLAKDNKGQWHYRNHAGTWQAYPGPCQEVAATVSASAYEFDRYINGELMAEGVVIENQRTLSEAMKRASQIAAKGPNGEAPVLVLRPAKQPPTTHKVEDEAVAELEPTPLMDLLAVASGLGARGDERSEKIIRSAVSAVVETVERLTRERDEAMDSAHGWHGQCQSVATILGLHEPEGIGHAESVRDKFDALEAKLTRAEAALAEAEKLIELAHPTMRACGWQLAINAEPEGDGVLEAACTEIEAKFEDYLSRQDRAGDGCAQDLNVRIAGLEKAVAIVRNTALYGAASVGLEFRDRKKAEGASVMATKLAEVVDATIRDTREVGNG
ncbi:hypothetical protein GCM10007989_07850 [Devosia pacifica]|uniref:Uncharacterized protein n=1 Tax=Devosia pacifica TaxID=1335967 RepID=A0A918RY40_9HYPH|nr:hypothetical protein [Devosia pacifica]GHA15503.1 hypothetical protein GCM10007989_07850 [Devosia pacifica]